VYNRNSASKFSRASLARADPFIFFHSLLRGFNRTATS